jgi:hypothetical protein
MNIVFLIIIIMILVIIYLGFFPDKFANNLLEAFCTKDSTKNHKCMNQSSTAISDSSGKTIRFWDPSDKQNLQAVLTTNSPTFNGHTLSLAGYQCIPSSFNSAQLNNTNDCNIWNSSSDALNDGKNAASNNYKTQSFYPDCSSKGKNSPGCAIGYNAIGYKSYSDFGYSCNIGNGTIPAKMDSSGVITCATDTSGKCIVASSKDECNQIINLVPTQNGSTTNDVSSMTCSNGKVGSQCIDMYNNLGIKSLGELGYSCNQNIGQNNIPGKVVNDSTYNFASYDGTNFVKNCPTAINFQPSSTIKDAVCSEYQTKLDPAYPTACEQAYTQYNLYPSTNPLVIKGNDPNYTVKSTWTDPNSLFQIYTKYQSSFPTGTDTNSSSSITQGIEDILSESPLKMACCRRSNPQNNASLNVSVRVPVNPTTESINPYTKQFNFQVAPISLPPNSCPANLYSGSPDCNNFFGLTCDNVMNYMGQQKISVESELINYAPECACYAPQTKDQAGYPSTTPAVCYKDGCDLSSNPAVYLDPNSRNGDQAKTCSMTVCNTINDFAGMTVGGSANISTQAENKCGAAPPSQPTQTNQTTQAPQTTQTGSTTSNNAGSTTATTSNTSSNASGNKTNTTSTGTPSSSSSGTTSTPSTGTTSTDSTDTSSSPNTLGIIIIVLVLLCSIGSGIFYFTRK